MFKSYNFFPTNVWEGIFPEYLQPLEKPCEDIMSNITETGVNKSYQSEELQNNDKFSFFKKDIAKYSTDFLISTGSKFNNLKFTSLWLQEFSSKGGGHHTPHVHSNTHVSGFYFLKCNKETSKPVFYDPRPGAEMNKLPQEIENINLSSIPDITFHTIPGSMIIFPSFLFHGHLPDLGISPYRFIHWHMKAE
tara:strand:- start:540 stop:1115 length:576 start_codon:yes stop_codon:yes gene_type:complete